MKLFLLYYQQDKLCKIISLRIREDQPIKNEFDYSMFWLLLAGVIPLVVFYINKKKIEAPKTGTLLEKSINNNLDIGRSTFDPTCLLFSFNGESKTLTFREGKLFEYFIRF